MQEMNMSAEAVMRNVKCSTCSQYATCAWTYPDVAGTVYACRAHDPVITRNQPVITRAGFCYRNLMTAAAHATVHVPPVEYRSRIP